MFYQNTRVDFQTLDGETYMWKAFEGQWTVINYFAPWCAPCLREMPELNSLSQNLPANTRLFAINYDHKTVAELRAMAQQFTIEVPLIVADEKTRLPMKKPPYLPATFIVGPSGEVVDTIMGEVTADGIRQRLSAMQNIDE
ncbi:TlpA disulfide reductase family protein [Alteromonas sp. D210916BOD_24]